MIEKTITPKNSYALFSGIGGLLLAISLLVISLYLDDIVPSNVLQYVNNSLPIIRLGLMVLSIVFLLIYFYRYYYISKTQYIIDDDNIRYKRGVFSIKEDNIKLYRVKDIIINRPFILRIIKSMTIRLLTSDKSHPTLDLTGIPLSDLADKIDQMVELNRKKNGVYEID